MHKEEANKEIGKNIDRTRKEIKKAIDEFYIINQTVTLIEDLDQIINTMTKRLIDWYNLYLPELSNRVSDSKILIDLIFTKSRTELISQLKLNEEYVMGKEANEEEIRAIKSLAREIIELQKLREKQEVFLNSMVKRNCPNTFELCGGALTAKILRLARGLKRLAMMPSSAIQVIGAEEAIFRHLRSNAKTPKHGIIAQHPAISSAKRMDRGKIARTLASKIAMASKIDFFKGKFIGDKLRRELDERRRA